MNKLLRLIQHRLWDETDAARALPKDALARIEQRVRESETQHSGEICVCVEASLPLSYLWRGASARDRAITQFGKLRVWDTAGNNGVLIYLLLVEHKVEIVADRGLNAHVSQAQWQAVLDTMRSEFQAGRFEAGLLAAVDQVDALLRQYCPLPSGQGAVNEMPDAVRLG
ncbi:MAG: TPM domain-containing protein [Burkholderiales bacterium]